MATRGIQVSCRVRHDISHGTWSPCVNVDTSMCRVELRPTTDGSSNVSTVDSDNKSMVYSCFDGVYSDQSTQEQVFESVGRPFVADLLAGYNCTIIVYGQTGSGKTYTVVGRRTADARGLVPRAMEAIIQQMACVDPAEYEVALTASFIEIYQEKLRDLLLPHSSRPLRLREDQEHDVRVEGASEIAISSMADGMAVLSRGNAQRSTGSTLMNTDSSRSHSVLILTLTNKHLTSGTKVRGKLFIVDLAGSEKVQKTAATGVRMEEAKHINRSLSALGNVINALTMENVKHVPYRDSKLTRLLQTSLGGNAKTHLLLTCSARIEHLDETLSTLRFGSRAKHIQNRPHVNKESAGATTEYDELLTTLQNKIEILHSYIQQLETTRCDACKSRGLNVNIQSSAACPVDEDPVNDADKRSLDNCDFIADDLVRSEIQSLRKTLTKMMHDHEAHKHDHNDARAMMEVTEQQLDARHRSEEQTIQQQELELRAATATSARLEKKLELVEESARGMSAELNRLRCQQHQHRQGEDAEAEILRRQLDLSTQVSKQLQIKLTASRQEHENLVDLVRSKEHELSSLRTEMEILRFKKSPVVLPSAVTLDLPSPCRNPQTRPVTIVEFNALATTTGSYDVKHPSAGTSNIQKWWAGTLDDLSGRNQDENAAWLERRVFEHVKPSSISSNSIQSEPCRDHSSVNYKHKDGLVHSSRVCNTANSTSRPFRARLVGLLNSLEEQTTAYKELVEETKERAISRGGSRPRRQLPCLDVAVPPPTSP